MNIPLLRLKYLFERYYYKSATQEETDELFSMINTGQYDGELLVIMQELGENVQPDTSETGFLNPEFILKKVFDTEAVSEARVLKLVKSNYKRRLLTQLAVAAAILLFIGLGVYLFRPFKVNTVNTLALKHQRQLHDALPGSNKAVLQLGNGKTILLDNTGNGLLAKQGTVAIKKTASGQLLYQYAKTSKAAPAINLISTPKGGQYQIILSDGTKVWLNAASSIRFPTCFTGTSRQVNITGEVYFEVAKNAAMPFEVHTSRGLIKVLGTHFNVMDYEDEPEMKTTLLEGAVSIQHNEFSGTLKPGQQAVIGNSGHESILSNVDVEDDIAWKQGIFHFNDASVDAIMRQAARWYDLNVIYREDIPGKKFTGHISRNVKASQLLNMFKYSGINVHIEGNNLILGK